LVRAATRTLLQIENQKSKIENHMNYPPLTPELIIRAYCQGAFPMARSRRGPIEWFSPDPRGILPLDAFHVPKSLARRVRSGRFHITFDRAFERVITACSEPRPYEEQTWISPGIIRAYTRLHPMGIAHSVEAWLPPPPEVEEAAQQPPPPATEFDASSWQLVGGLYGLALGGAFFGESMFAAAPDASKVAFVTLVRQLSRWGIDLVDCQVHTDHLERFGAEEWPRATFLAALKKALELPTRRGAWRLDAIAEEAGSAED
jgi:leucyl/phenylalanyl-tRNA--protein transferase